MAEVQYLDLLFVGLILCVFVILYIHYKIYNFFPKVDDGKAENERRTLSILSFTALFSAAAFIAAGLADIVFYLQLSESRDEQRPWIYVSSVVPAGRILLEEGKYFLPLKVTIKNTGHLPGFYVIQKTDATVLAMGKDKTTSVKNSVCDTYRSEPLKSGNGDTIFSNETITHGGFTHDDYPRFEKTLWDSKGPDRLLVVYGCVDYQFPSQPGHHQSRFSFVVGKLQDQEILERIGPLPTDPTTVDVRLLPITIDGGASAD